VVDEDRRLEGTIARSKLGMSGEGEHLVGDLVDSGAPTVSVTSRLDVALESLTAAPQSWVPVLDDERRVVGTLSVSDVVRAYREELVMSAQRVSELGLTAGVAQVTVTAKSLVAGRTLRMAGLPPGLLITSISRRGEVFFPTGDDTLEIGDHLTVIGRGFDLSRIGNVTSIGPAE
jgi:CBS domain-containing protein